MEGREGTFISCMVIPFFVNQKLLVLVTNDAMKEVGVHQLKCGCSSHWYWIYVG